MTEADSMASPGETEPHVLPDPGARRRFEELALPHLKHLYRLAIRLKAQRRTPRISSRKRA
jgi:hypothetical protein